MKIIDWERKGNLVRFYLGKDDLKEWWGDDWDDTPYEHNAGTVYDEYVSGHTDICFPWDYTVLEPCCGIWNSPYSKKDMIRCKVPCVIVAPLDPDSFDPSFQELVGAKDGSGIVKYYFGDQMEPTEEVIVYE
ncbi:MAG: hypothetical protein IJM90_04620 [Firmicutes bacterium]|nr:hypothetical protein [Bacillota bacterium]